MKVPEKYFDDCQAFVDGEEISEEFERYLNDHYNLFIYLQNKIRCAQLASIMSYNSNETLYLIYDNNQLVEILEGPKDFDLANITIENLIKNHGFKKRKYHEIKLALVK